jgi:Ca-activated chloride channel homolog
METHEWGVISDHLIIPLVVILLVIFGVSFYSFRLKGKRLQLIGSSLSIGRFFRREFPLLLAAIFCALIPLRPYYGKEEIPHTVASAELIILFDVSSSMLADDLKPSRLVHARRTVERILRLAQNEVATKVAIVLFAGTSYLYCPLTPDLEAVGLFLDGVTTELISTPGSALTEALQTAQNAFTKDGPSPKTLLVVTDGEEENFDIDKASSILKESGAKLVIYGVGTERGAPIRQENGRFLKNDDGQIVISSLNKNSLNKLTTRLGGTLITASRSSADARALVKTLPQSSTTQDMTTEHGTTFRFKELGPLCALITLFLLLVAAYGTPEPLILGLIFFLTIPKGVAAQATRLAEGYEAYQNSDFATAREIFTKAHETQPENARVTRALANTLYRLGEFEAAEQLFANAHKGADSTAESFMSAYNQGNAAFEKGDFPSAQKAYKQALEVKPDNAAALHNLKLAEKMARQQKQQQQSSDSEEDSSEPEKSPSQQKQNSENKQKSEDKESQSEEQDDPQEDSSQSKESDDSKTKKSEKQSGEDGENDAENKDSESSPTEKQDQKETKKDSELKQKQSNQQTQPSSEDKEQKGEDATVSDDAVDAWLDTLPDRPIVRRQNRQGRIPPGGQTW